jgi:hypothetical protein
MVRRFYKMETKKQAVGKTTTESIGVTEMQIDWESILLNSFRKMANREGWRIDIYPDGSTCEFFGNSQPLKNTSVFSVKGWKLTDNPTWTSFGQDDKEKEGFVWDVYNNEWETIENAIECEVDAYKEYEMNEDVKAIENEIAEQIEENEE